MITWTKISDKTDLPTTEVLATDGLGEWLVGYLSFDPEFESISCETDETILNDVTHYSHLNNPN